MINALLNVCRQRRYHRQAEADTAVLYALADDGQHHVYGDLHSTTGLRPGLLYSALSRLMRRGLVEDGWDESRRWYQLSDAGRAEVAPRITPRTERNL
ncbi:MAG: PadR family transcriptional regulator [Pseudonocardia sp.]|nr:PadR family transcriptional regulator [Pseudonocardia sp.]